MRKKKNIKLKNSDILVCSICILGIVYSLFNYFSDIYHTSNRSDIEPIAFIATKVKSVQRRFHDRLVWDMLKNNSALYAGDFVRTGENSMAEIKFESGTLIMMGQDSLIEILPESGNARLLIAAGNVNINTTQKMRLMAGNEIVELAENSIVNMTIEPLPEVEEITDNGVENASAGGRASAKEYAGGETGGAEASAKNARSGKTPDKIKVAGSIGKKNKEEAQTVENQISKTVRPKTTASVVSVKVEQGKLSQSQINGSVVEVNAGKQVVLSQKQVYTEPALVITSPQVKHQIIKSLSDKANVEFEWQAYNLPQNYKLCVEIAYDENFKYPYKTQQFEIGQNTGTFADLPSRLMFWKAYPVEDGAKVPAGEYEKLLQRGSISVYSVTPVKKLRPFNNAQITYKGAKSGVTFAWTQDNFAKGYRLIITADDDFTKPVFVASTTETSMNVLDLPSGDLFWQVQSIYDDSMQIGDSESEIFAFSVQEKPELLAPQCIKPANLEVHYTAGGRQPLVFAWQNVSSAAEYTLFIADNPRLKNPAVQITTKELYFSLVPSKYNLEEGKPWYWGVSYSDKEGSVSQVSKISSFYMLNAKPYLNCPVPGNNFEIKCGELKNLLFELDTNLPVEKTFAVAKDSSFADIVLQAEISKNAFKVSSELLPGEYYWRVNCGKLNSETRKIILLADEASEN